MGICMDAKYGEIFTVSVYQWRDLFEFDLSLLSTNIRILIHVFKCKFILPVIALQNYKVPNVTIKVINYSNFATIWT